MEDLFNWINIVTPEEFPPVPFKIAPWLTILNVETVLNGLRQDIALNTYRVKTGAVNEDLRRLHEVWKLHSENIKKTPSWEF